MDTTRLFVHWLALMASILAGCAGRMPFANSGSEDGQALRAGLSDAQALANQNLMPSPGQSAYNVTPLGQFPAQPKSGVTGKMTSAIKKVSQSVSNTLAIKPKVITADDPTKMSSDPGRIDPQLYVTAGHIHEQRGNFQAAKEQYRRALKIDPTHLKALLSYARVNDRMEHFEEATRIYQQTINAHPNSAIALNDLALCYARQGLIQQSIDMLNRAIQIEPAKKLYRNNLATIFVEIGRNEEAFEHLVASHGPAVAHYNLGFFLYQRDQRQEAIRHFAQAAELDPTLTAAKRMLQQLGAVPPANRQSAVVDDGSYEVQASIVKAISTDSEAWKLTAETSAITLSIEDAASPIPQATADDKLVRGEPPIPLKPIDNKSTVSEGTDEESFDYFEGTEVFDSADVVVD